MDIKGLVLRLVQEQIASSNVSFEVVEETVTRSRRIKDSKDFEVVQNVTRTLVRRQAGADTEIGTIYLNDDDGSIKHVLIGREVPFSAVPRAVRELAS